MNRFKNKIKRLLKIKGARSIYLYSVVIGGIAGLGAIVFSYALSYAERFMYTQVMGLPRSHPAGDIHVEAWPLVTSHTWMILLSPTLGGLLVGLLVHFFSPTAHGTGTEGMINAFHYEEGRISLKVSFYKAIATIITLSTGGSAGKEGPASQIGAGLGSKIARLINAGARARRTLMLAGTAGGLGALFQAPLGGAITAIEVVYKEDIESDAMIPCIISSVTAYLVFTGVTGSTSVFRIPKVSFEHYSLVVCYLVLALLNAGLGFLFLKLFNSLRDWFEKFSLHRILKPAFGGLVVGCVGIWFPDVIGTAMGLLQRIFDDPSLNSIKVFAGHSSYQMAAIFMGLALLKMIVTSFTINSGGSGGVMGPSLFIGGMIGASVGCVAQSLFPNYDISLASFILVGMGSFFAGVTSAPIAGIVMVSDMAGSYVLLLPLMVVTTFTLIISKKRSIYRGQLNNRFDSPAHYWDMTSDRLEEELVADIDRDQADQHKEIHKKTI